MGCIIHEALHEGSTVCQIVINIPSNEGPALISRTLQFTSAYHASMTGWMTHNCSSFLTVFRSGRREGDNERRFAMEPCLQLEKFLPQAGLESGTATSAGQRV